MKEGTLGIIIGLLNFILIAVCVVFFLGKDRTAPVITLEPVNFVYEEDLPQRLLYQGVTAYDEKDGDVTSAVVVEKVVTDRVRGTATITYGACDTSGNVGKETRIMEMPVMTVIQFPGAGEADINKGPQNAVQDTEEETTEVTEETAETEGSEETAEEGEAAVENEDVPNTDEIDAQNTEVTEDTEESETTENEGEGTTGGNVTVVGSNNRRN